jgi:hypothetical protein
MLFALIPIAWLSIVAIVLVACRSAARGDRVMRQEAPQPPPRSLPPMARVRWQDGPGSGAQGLRAARSGTVVRERVSRAGHSRGRGAQCTTRP